MHALKCQAVCTMRPYTSSRCSQFALASILDRPIKSRKRIKTKVLHFILARPTQCTWIWRIEERKASRQDLLLFTQLRQIFTDFRNSFTCIYKQKICNKSIIKYLHPTPTLPDFDHFTTNAKLHFFCIPWQWPTLHTLARILSSIWRQLSMTVTDSVTAWWSCAVYRHVMVRVRGISVLLLLSKKLKSRSMQWEIPNHDKISSLRYIIFVLVSTTSLLSIKHWRTGCANKNNPLEKLLYITNGKTKLSKLSHFICEWSHDVSWKFH